MLKLEDCAIGVGKTLYRIELAKLAPGKMVALVGANGAGKSTLLNAIALGAEIIGNISWNDKSLAEHSPEEKSTIVSLVESSFSGALYLSTKEYLDLGRFPYTGLSGKLSAEDELIVSSFAEKFNLNHLLSQSTLTLSDGERQRAGIARALIQQTPLMLLDEPTSFLDYPNKRAIMKMLSEIAHNDKKAILLASHDLDLCLEFADEFLVINPETKKLESFAAKDLTLDLLVEKAFGKVY